MSLPTTTPIPRSPVWLRLVRASGPPGLAAGVALGWGAVVPAGVLATVAVLLGGLALGAPGAMAGLGRAGAAVGWGVRRALTVLLLGGLYLLVFPLGRLLSVASGRPSAAGLRGAVASAGWRSRSSSGTDPIRSA